MEIKAIQCPNCGSARKTELRPNHFRCDSCGSEYVLDDGKTTVFVSTGSNGTNVPSDNSLKKKTLLFALGGMAVVLLILVVVISSSGSGSTYQPSNTRVVSGLPDHRWNWSESYVFTTKENKAVLFSLGNRTVDHPGSNAEEVSYAVFTDAETGAKLKSVRIPHYESEGRITIREFSNGDIFITNSDNSLFRVSKSDFSYTDVSKSLFADQAELINGVATIEFVAYDKEDGFKLVTNDGKTLNFFPLVHKVYTNEQLWTAEQGFKNLLPGSTEKTGFTFCSFFTYGQTGDPDPPQLLKYRFRDNGGGPKTGVGTLPKGVNDQNQQNPRVISYVNFTPGRVYFSEKMLYYDDDYVLISYQPTAARTAAGPQVQCLDARTGKIVFTMKMPDDASYITGAVRSKNGFSLLNYNSVYHLGVDGKIDHLTQSKDYEF